MAEEVRVYVETSIGNGVENVYVGLHDSASKALLQSDTTDVSGVAVFPNVDEALNAGVYEIRIVPSAPSAVVLGKVQNITVLASPPADPNDFNVQVTLEGLSTAVNPRLCRCSGYFVDSTGQPIQNLSVKFTEECVPKLEYQSEATYGTKAVIPSLRTVKTDATGKIQLDLYRKAKYQAHMQGLINVSRLVEVPDLASVNLPDLLFPYVGTVEWFNSDVQIVPTAAPTLTISLAAGAKALTHKVKIRSGVYVDLTEVTLGSNDTAVLEVTRSGSTVTLTPKVQGTATITITRVTNSEDGDIISPIPDVLGELVVTVNA